MIIVLPALGVIIQQAAQAVAVGALIGAITGAGTGAAVEVVSGVRQHGEINQHVVHAAAHMAGESAVDGALVGGAFGAVGFVAGPVIGAAGKAAQPIVSMVDDAAGPAGRAIGGAVTSAAHTIDDFVRPALTQVGGTIGSGVRSVGRTISAPFRMARSAWIARFSSGSAMKAACSRGCVYVMDDTANGLSKVGVTTSPQRRLADVSRQVSSDVRYISVAPIDDAYAAEAALKRQFVSKNVPHPNHATGTEWFSGLSPMDVATAMSK